MGRKKAGRKQLNARYLSVNSDQPKDFVLHPLGLIMRGAVIYLVASAWDYDEARLYALHRFNTVEILDAAARTTPQTPPNPNMKSIASITMASLYCYPGNERMIRPFL